MKLTERKKQILKIVVESYVRTAEPVGSRTIAAQMRGSVSSATIRNDLSDLTECGYLDQPHTSAGRAPTPKGYRLYVDTLMERRRVSEEETARIHAALQMRLRELDRIISQAGQAVASYLNYPAYVAASGTKRLTVRRFDLIAVDGGQNIVVLMFSNNRVKSQLFHVRLPLEAEELALLSGLLNDRFTDRSAGEMGIQLMEWTERLAPAAFLFLSQIVSYACDVMEEQQRRIFTAGAKELLRLPEFRDVEKAHALMSILSDGKESLPVPEDGKPMQILIGPENITDALKERNTECEADAVRHVFDSNNTGSLSVERSIGSNADNHIRRGVCDRKTDGVFQFSLTEDT